MTTPSKRRLVDPYGLGTAEGGQVFAEFSVLVQTWLHTTLQTYDAVDVEKLCKDVLGYEIALIKLRNSRIKGRCDEENPGGESQAQ